MNSFRPRNEMNKMTTIKFYSRKELENVLKSSKTKISVSDKSAIVKEAKKRDWVGQLKITRDRIYIMGEPIIRFIEEDEELKYPDVYYLPTLFTLDKAGKERIWKIWVEDNVVRRLQGLVDGKKQTYEREYFGKNIGKKNETTSDEQAKQEAETLWTKQLDKGYLPKCEEGLALIKKLEKETSKSGGHNINSTAVIGGRKGKKITETNNLAVDKVDVYIKPMKASEWELEDPQDHTSVKSKVIKYFNFDEGVYLQTKLDGWRCVARLQTTSTGEVCVLTTNNGKQYPWFRNLRDEITEFLKKNKGKYLDGLDGELYSHELYDSEGNLMNDEMRFNRISSTCSISRKTPDPLEDQMQFIVFDLVDLSGEKTQDERINLLKRLFKNKPKKVENVKLCETVTIFSIDDVYKFHDTFSQDGYEGVILRSKDLNYTNKRSLSMRKYKYFIDREYTLIDVEKKKGVEDEYFVWVCIDENIIDSKSGEYKRFKAKPTGTTEEREEWYRNYTNFLGMKLKVKFQEYTEEGVPRFPVASGIREDQ